MTTVHTHGLYKLEVNDIGGGFLIRRQGPARVRTVAFVDSVAQWERFVAALEAGHGEVVAVHAIDRKSA